MAGSAQQAAESVRSQEKEVARIGAFSDAVFAIAITLLALQLDVAKGDSVDVWDALRHLWPSFLSFAISFAVIGAYWVAHHRLYALIERYDRKLLWMNLLSLFFIVVMPFTTSLIGEHGDQNASVIVYALSVALAGFASTGMAVYALGGHRLCARDVDDRRIKYFIWQGLVIALVFVFSLVFLPLGPSVVELSWLSLVVLQPIVHHLLARGGEV